jgi:alkylhydroperoxidase family enzyme
VVEGWEAMLTAIRQKTSLSPRVREMIILRVAVLNNAPYEFEAHISHALAGGLPQSVIDAMRHDTAAADIEGLSQEDRDILAFTDAMTRDIEVSDACFDALSPKLGPQGMVDLAATVGAYNMVSRFLSALRIGH